MELGALPTSSSSVSKCFASSVVQRQGKLQRLVRTWALPELDIGHSQPMLKTGNGGSDKSRNIMALGSRAMLIVTPVKMALIWECSANRLAHAKSK